MDSIYWIIIVALLLLAAFDLINGVANDAVNFLNSAIGSKAAPGTIRGDFGNDPASLFTEPRIGISPGIDHIPLFARQSYASQRF